MRLRNVGSLLLLLALSACLPQKETQVPPKKAKALQGASGLKEKKKADEKESVSEEQEALPLLPWAKSTYSPRPGSPPDPRLEEAAALCGQGDSALHEVALLLAEQEPAQRKGTRLERANFHLRRKGSPYVMPRLWSATMSEFAGEEIADSISEWAQTRPALGEYRCGLGSAQHADGSVSVTVLQVDVLAEVSPLPTQVESGQWLELQSNFLRPTNSATVLILPPEGPPRRLNPLVKGDRINARFSIETAGTWLIQVMATQAGGPRQVAQILVTADQAPPRGPDSRPVPGEDALDASLSPEAALFKLMNAAREDQGLPLLKRHHSLDRVARHHSITMRDQDRISHNTGSGDPDQRVRQTGLRPKATGENVARAASVLRLHRALWSSPAHRENLLLRRWDQAGVGIAKGENGSLFAAQLFMDAD